jgi:hypothetical protein
MYLWTHRPPECAIFFVWLLGRKLVVVVSHQCRDAAGGPADTERMEPAGCLLLLCLVSWLDVGWVRLMEFCLSDS